LENPPIEKIDARYIGLLKFSIEGLRFIQETMEAAYKKFEEKPWQQSGKTVRKAYMTDLLNAIIESDREVKAVHFNNGWIEFDTNEDYENAIEWVKDKTISELIKL
jgi:NDP-sugar pyrophosphorylase family protein